MADNDSKHQASKDLAMTTQEGKPWFKHWPPGVPKAIDPVPIPLDQILRDAARAFPDAIATTYYDAQLTYAKLDEIADRIATGLVKLGLKKGDTVALHFTNVPPCIASYFGVLRAGGIVTLISPLFKSLEIKYQLKDSDARFLVVWEGFDGLYDYDGLPKETGVTTIIHSSLGNWFLPDPVAADAMSADGKVLYLEDMIRTSPPAPPHVSINPLEDLAVLQYTGGTTGLPKGGMLTHFNIVVNIHQVKAIFPECEPGKEVMMTALPLYHIYAQCACMNFGILIAANSVLVANPREATELLEAIEKHKITIFPGVAAMFNLLNNHEGIEHADLKSIKYCTSGAGPLPKEVQDKFEKLTGAKLREGYGLTEASPFVSVNPLRGRFKNGTVGLPLPSTDIKIVDVETGTKVLGITEIGELCVQGPQVFKGYYKKPEETRKTIRDGWLYTGDAALIDDEGYIVIKERLKNMLKYKGHSVYPTEVEALLYENPAVLECAVIGIPDKEVGENIKAFIVLKPEFQGKVTVSDIIDWAKKNMAQYKAPRIVEFIDEIPKSRIGKTLHRVLREGKTEMD
ncbi:MAG: long-chain fatty acid--CoA ligase [Candidatus Lokiarchaeota archaeon]|nr:long-chain fatty acid--CoA ligase [Candidatus Lokiarchaeota archaeon]